MPATRSQDNCPLCGAAVPVERVPPPDWHTRENRLILSYDCEGNCGSMLIDTEGRHPKVELGVLDLLNGAIPDELLFLSRSNRNWVDSVVYEPYMLSRLLDAQRAAVIASARFGFEDQKSSGQRMGSISRMSW